MFGRKSGAKYAISFCHVWPFQGKRNLQQEIPRESFKKIAIFYDLHQKSENAEISFAVKVRGSSDNDVTLLGAQRRMMQTQRDEVKSICDAIYGWSLYLQFFFTDGKLSWVPWNWLFFASIFKQTKLKARAQHNNTTHTRGGKVNEDDPPWGKTKRTTR